MVAELPANLLAVSKSSRAVNHLPHHFFRRLQRTGRWIAFCNITYTTAETPCRSAWGRAPRRAADRSLHISFATVAIDSSVRSSFVHIEITHCWELILVCKKVQTLMSTASTEVSLSILCSRYIRIVQIDDFHSYISFSGWTSRSQLSAVSNRSSMLKARGNRTCGNWQKQRKYRYCKDQLSIFFLISCNQRDALSAFYKTELRCSTSPRNDDFLNSISPILYLQQSIADVSAS